MASKPLKYEDAKGRVTWRVKWRYGGTRDGAWQTVTGMTHEEAKTLRREVESRGHMVKRTDPEVLDRSLMTGRPTASSRPASEAPTWPEAAQAYLSERSGLTKGTVAIYTRYLTMHLDRWDGMRVDAITKADCAALVNAYGVVEGGQGYGQWVLAKAVLAFAIRKGWRQDDPTEEVRLFKKGEGVALYLTEEERALLLRAVDTASRCPKEWPIMVRLALGTGLRVSELCGLQARDLRVGESESTLTVARQNQREGGQRVTTPTKGGASRTIILSPDDAAALAALAKGKRHNAWLFPAPDGGPLVRDTVQGRWERAVERASGWGLDRSPRFHDLRHTHASILLESGVSMLAVSRRLGHESIRITEETYGHLGKSSDSQIVAALSNQPKERLLKAV